MPLGETAALIPGARVETIPDCGHFPWAERPASNVVTEISIDNRASASQTVIEILTRDRSGLLFALSTMFSKQKQKKTKAVGEKEKLRSKRIAKLEAEADKKPPHLTGKR